MQSAEDGQIVCYCISFEGPEPGLIKFAALGTKSPARPHRVTRALVSGIVGPRHRAGDLIIRRGAVLCVLFIAHHLYRSICNG
jgi:hypothetical protein